MTDTRRDQSTRLPYPGHAQKTGGRYPASPVSRLISRNQETCGLGEINLGNQQSFLAELCRASYRGATGRYCANTSCRVLRTVDRVLELIVPTRLTRRILSTALI